MASHGNHGSYIAHAPYPVHSTAEGTSRYVSLPQKIIGNRLTMQVPRPRLSQYNTFIIYN